MHMDVVLQKDSGGLVFIFYQLLHSLQICFICYREGKLS